VGLGIKWLTSPSQYRFQFRIAPALATSTSPVYADGKIQKIAERIKEATPPHTLTFNTFWAKGTIQLTLEEPETIVTGTVRRAWGVREWAILLAFLAIFYGVVGSLIILPLYLVSYLLFDIIGNTPRKAIGSQLRLALDGGQFQQTAWKFSFKRRQFQRIR